jgi:ATPase family AAA domain-containing protein 3A/B
MQRMHSAISRQALPCLNDARVVRIELLPTCRQMERFLNTPSLVRETSRYNVLQRARNALGLNSGTPVAIDTALQQADKTFADVILAADIKDSIRMLAAGAANTRLHGAPFRHFLLYGPPGTGKTMVAKRLAHTSGLDYAIMSGGDVAPLGANAVKEIHSTFDWAKRSPKGMVLFVDEADAFLSHRGKAETSEALRSAINAMLYRTGDQSQDLMVVLATNRPGTHVPESTGFFPRQVLRSAAVHKGHVV